MPAPKNQFKADLKAGKRIFGCWLSLGNMLSAEIMGTCGFDWLLVDGEHSVYDIKDMRSCLAALESSPSSAAVRVPIGETWIIKQVLDAGAQTVLVPMVESKEQAEQLVRAVRYPPVGERGVGYSSARCSVFGQITDYAANADEEICLLVQVENRKGMEALDDILQVDGIDGVFIGPADLSADLGYLGDIKHPDAQKVLMELLGRIAASDKAAGVLSTDPAMTQECIDAGAQFVAVGLDILLLRNAAIDLRKSWMG